MSTSPTSRVKDLIEAAEAASKADSSINSANLEFANAFSIYTAALTQIEQNRQIGQKVCQSIKNKEIEDLLAQQALLLFETKEIMAKTLDAFQKLHHSAQLVKQKVSQISTFSYQGDVCTNQEEEKKSSSGLSDITSSFKRLSTNR